MISSLIMDISGSSQADKAVFKDLGWLEKEIRTWVADNDFSHVDYRMGDELFVLSSIPYHTLFIAIHAKLLWPHNDFPLKCGYHTADIEPPKADPEQWSHPAIKDTRKSLESVKKLAVLDFASPKMPDEIEIALMYATDIINGMTPLQQEVASLKIAGMLQRDISQALDKTESTVSAHYRKSRGKQLEHIIYFLADYYEVNIQALNDHFRNSLKRRLQL